MSSEKHLHGYLCVCFYFDSCHESHRNWVHMPVWMSMCVFQSAVCFPDSAIGFWGLTSLAWPQNGKPLHTRCLSSFFLQRSPLPCSVHALVTPDQSHSFHTPGVCVCFCHSHSTCSQRSWNDLLSLTRWANYTSDPKIPLPPPALPAWLSKGNPQIDVPKTSGPFCVMPTSHCIMVTNTVLGFHCVMFFWLPGNAYARSKFWEINGISEKINIPGHSPPPPYF